jgi:glycosyltransferase involved in cell wall biosynthesis
LRVQVVLQHVQEFDLMKGAMSSPVSESVVRPLFTIAIPTFNRAGWLKDCVHSALSQEFDSFEVVVSDNASEDDTAEVLRQFIDARLVTIRQPNNIGPIGNWNACLAAARGTYIVILCDDDSVAPHLLKRCGQLVGEDASIPVIVALGDVFEPKSGLRRPAITSQSIDSGICDGTELLLEFLRGRISPAMCTIAMKTEVLRSRGGFPEGWPHTGDLVSWVPMLLAQKAGFVNESCGAYRSHEGTQTSNFSVQTRLKDIDRLARVIVEESERNVSDGALLLEIRRAARRYVGCNCIGHLTMERRKGASRVEVGQVAWAWRRQLMGAGIPGLKLLPRPLVLFFLPLWTAQCVSAMKRVARGLRLSRLTTAVGSE